MTGRSHSTVPAAQDDPLCEWCHARQRFHSPSALSRHASLLANQAERLTASSPVSEPEIRRLARLADSSSLTRRGGGASRSWSVTGSSGSVCRRLRLGRSGSTSRRGTSASGMATGSRSASSKWWLGEGGTTGREVLTHVELDEFERAIRRKPVWGRSTDRLRDPDDLRDPRYGAVASRAHYEEVE
jgi:hypothetical protein